LEDFHVVKINPAVTSQPALRVASEVEMTKQMTWLSVRVVVLNLMLMLLQQLMLHLGQV